MRTRKTTHTDSTPTTPQTLKVALWTVLSGLTPAEITEQLHTWASDPETTIEAIKAVRRWAVTPVHSIKRKATYDGQRAAEVKTLDLTSKEFAIREAVLACESDEEPATYGAVSALTGLGISQVAGSTSVLLTKGFVEVHKEETNSETGRTESVIYLTDNGRTATLRVPKPKKGDGRQEIKNASTPEVSDSGGIPAWTKSITVTQIVEQDWDLQTQTLDDLEEAMEGKSPKTKLGTLWLNLPSSTTDDLVQCWEARNAN